MTTVIASAFVLGQADFPIPLDIVWLLAYGVIALFLFCLGVMFFHAFRRPRATGASQADTAPGGARGRGAGQTQKRPLATPERGASRPGGATRAGRGAASPATQRSERSARPSGSGDGHARGSQGGIGQPPSSAA